MPQVAVAAAQVAPMGFGNGQEWDSTHGSGGGGGGGGFNAATSGVGGSYGGGGGGRIAGTGNTGGPGIIVVTYTPFTPVAVTPWEFPRGFNLRRVVAY